MVFGEAPSGFDGESGDYRIFIDFDDWFFGTETVTEAVVVFPQSSVTS